MGSGDWLDIDDKPGSPAVVEIPADYAARVALLDDAWPRLSPNQRMFLSAWRDCRYNANAACRRLGLSEKTKPMAAGRQDPDFALVVRIWQANVAADALDRDRLLARQDDIVETLLTPKPILHQGVPTGYMEVEAGAASRANEVLLDRAMPKPRADVEVNVGVAFTPVQVEVEKSPGTVIEAQFEVVEASPVLPAEEDWLA